MSEKYENADLILKLYDLRREEVMRKARSWFLGDFHPGSMEEVSATAMGEHSAYFRMVLTYWDMACSMVTNGAIDEQMFNDANSEHIAVFSKIEPFIAEIRTASGMQHYMKHLETVVNNVENAPERMTRMREMLKQMNTARAAKQGG